MSQQNTEYRSTLACIGHLEYLSIENVKPIQIPLQYFYQIYLYKCSLPIKHPHPLPLQTLR